MEAFINDHYILILLAMIAVPSLAVSVASVVYCLRHRVSRMSVSRDGIEIHTNDIPIWSSIVDKIRDIDSETSKSIRQGTTGLTILMLEKYGVSAEVMLVNSKANEPLTHAAYENHHTRQLAKKGGEVYLTNKANDIFTAVQPWKKQFPALTWELADCFASLWVKKVLVSILQDACEEKIAFYKQQLVRKEVSTTIKDIVKACLEKNEGYLVNIDELANLSNIKTKSNIFLQPS